MMEKGLLEKTGKPLDHWIKVVNQANIEKHGEIVNHLKSTYGFTHGFANFVAHKSRKSDAGSVDDPTLMRNQYEGKASLIPIYEKLLQAIATFGGDITITPKKDSVSLIRKKQFALVKPATKSRIDLGLKLKDFPITNRLESSGPFGAMCTHRVRLETVNEVDDELVAWLHQAYDRAV